MPFYQFSVDSEPSVDHTILKAGFAGLLIHSGGLGLQACLCIQSLSIVLSYPREKRNSHLRYIIIMMALLALSIYALVDDGRSLITLFLLYPDLLSGATPEYSRPLWSRGSHASSLGAIQVIGDAVLVWRCYIIWAHKRWVIVFPLIALFASLGLGVVATVADVMDAAGNHTLPDRKLQAAYFLASVGASVISTGLIVSRLIRMKNELRRSLPEDTRAFSVYDRVVSILIESALPFTIFGVVSAITFALESPSGTDSHGTRNVPIEVATSVVIPLWCLSLGLAPMLIIHRVVMGTSWINDPATNATGRVSSIAFGRSPGTQPGTDSHGSQTSGEMQLQSLHHVKEG
ncbi:hypothetical protein FA15DRAFT_223723 [Coprinopsis marcescibilis]|uniref:Uncharacterized protein n=1 Tax=Coprinopsis marcescibilis TaxID=230819 RepID=A0A5C3KGT9_COPMA|nr:hypothetical protein FA15DRAFT_223723 [Coprinopsis marcescibilis]